MSQLEQFSESSPLKHTKLNVKCSIIVVLRSSVMLNVHRWRNKTSLKVDTGMALQKHLPVHKMQNNGTDLSCTKN